MALDSTKDKLTTGEVARRLGVNHSTVSRWAIVGCGDRRLQGRKVGGRWFFTEQELVAFLDACNQLDGEEGRR